MDFSELSVAEAKLTTVKGDKKISLIGVEFCFITVKYLLGLASNKTATTHQYYEFIIDEITMTKTDYELFSIHELYHLEAVLLLTDSTNKTWAFKLKISNIHLSFLETDLLKIKKYIENSSDYITCRKIQFGTNNSNIHLNEFEDEIDL